MASFLDKMSKKASELKDMAAEKAAELAETVSETVDAATSSDDDESPFTDAEIEEMSARRERSIAIIEQEQVPIYDDLPMILPETHAPQRSHQEVAERAVALFIVSYKAVGGDEKIVEKMADKADDDDLFSPEEADFATEEDVEDSDRIQFSWRVEALNVLLWALGKVDTLPRPDKSVDWDPIVAMMSGISAKKLLSSSKMRPQAEVLDAADLIYRYHWAIRNEGVHGREAPDGLDSSVVLERHHALNWLIQFDGEDWDDVPTPT